MRLWPGKDLHTRMGRSVVLAYSTLSRSFITKERVISFIVSNGLDVYSSDSFKKVLKSEALTHELLMAMAEQKRILPGNEDYESMSINNLRLKLAELDADTDGSREMLIRRLEAEESSDTDEEEGDEEDA